MRKLLKCASAFLALIFVLSPLYAFAAEDEAEGKTEEVFVEDTDLASPPPDSKFVAASSFKKAEYVVGTAWTPVGQSQFADHIEGVRLHTDSSSFRLEYRVKPRGRDWTGWVDSRDSGKYAGVYGVPVTHLEIRVYSMVKGGYDKTDFVVMYRSKVAGEWLGWVSNARSGNMERIKSDFFLDGSLDAEATDAGWEALVNITSLEILVFEKRNHKAGTDAVMIDAPYINQYAVSLPNGCESVSAVMALRFAGVDTGTEEFVSKYLPKGKAPTDGVGADPAEAYVGDPHHTGDGLGWGCLSPVIVKALKSALFGKPYIVHDLTGSSVRDLCAGYIRRGIPVIFWATAEMTADCHYSLWWTSSGDKVSYNNELHCLLLVGYDSNYYYFNDPMTRIGSEKYFAYPKGAVEAAYELLGRGAVAIERVYCTGLDVTPPDDTRYVEGDPIDKSTLSVVAHLSDGTEKTVTDFSLTTDDAVYGADTVGVVWSYFGEQITSEFAVTVYERIRGDADGDGDVTMKDVLLCRRIIAGLEDLSAILMTNADCVEDNDVNMKDVLVIRRIVAGLD